MRAPYAYFAAGLFTGAACTGEASQGGLDASEPNPHLVVLSDVAVDVFGTDGRTVIETATVTFDRRRGIVEVPGPVRMTVYEEPLRSPK